MKISRYIVIVSLGTLLVLGVGTYWKLRATNLEKAKFFHGEWSGKIEGERCNLHFLKDGSLLVVWKSRKLANSEWEWSIENKGDYLVLFNTDPVFPKESTYMIRRNKSGQLFFQGVGGASMQFSLIEGD